MNTNPVEISSAQIAETIRLLRDAGRQECILLWLGHREQGLQRIVEVYKPLQEADRDYFVIPREGNRPAHRRAIDRAALLRRIHNG